MIDSYMRLTIDSSQQFEGVHKEITFAYQLTYICIHEKKTNLTSFNLKLITNKSSKITICFFVVS